MPISAQQIANARRASVAACWPRELHFAAASAIGRSCSRWAGAVLTDVDSLQYLELRDAESLEPVVGSVNRPAVLLAATFIGSTRLIDNVIL